MIKILIWSRKFKGLALIKSSQTMYSYIDKLSLWCPMLLNVSKKKFDDQIKQIIFTKVSTEANNFEKNNE